MKSIGGYFEIELDKKEEYHKKAIRLNTGRNALEYLLLSNSYAKIYLPFFTCDVLLEPLKKHNVAYEFYNIDRQLEPLFDYTKIKSDEAFLYTNYFGLKNSFIIQLAEICKNLIVDSAQAFFSKPISRIDTFYSPRKFFGIPDGAYLYSNKKMDIKLEKDKSFERCSHLLKRIDSGAEKGYVDFIENDSSLKNQDIKEMSTLTQTLLSTIDYNKCANKRIHNFNYLHQVLQSTNRLEIDTLNMSSPMVYPYWRNEKGLRQRLIDSKVYTAIYWDNVKQWCGEDSLEYKFVDEIVYLPIDQRYEAIDLNKIIKIINNEY